MNETDLIILKKRYIDSRGNNWSARKEPYQYGEMCKDIRDNLEYCVPVEKVTTEVKLIKPQTSKPEEVLIDKKGITEVVPQLSNTSFIEKKDIVDEEATAITLIENLQDSRLNINTATEEDLTKLEGVGTRTADKIMEEREVKLFNSIEDLDKRATLMFGKKWEEFVDKITF